MTDLSSIGDLIAGFVPEGPLRTAVFVVYGLCAAVAPFIFEYYLGVLAQGASPKGSIESQDYDKLRAGLKEGNIATWLYAKWLMKFLDWIDQFFGDAGLADRTLFPHAFGLRRPAPLWTAWSFDRCLFLTYVYPIATIFVIWTVSSHAGPAELALGLKPGIAGWLRGLNAASAGVVGFATWRLLKSESQTSVASTFSRFAFGTGASVSANTMAALCYIAAAIVLAITFGTAGAGAVVFGVAVAAAVAGSGRIGGPIAVAVAVPVALGLAFGLAGARRDTVAFVAAAAAIFSTSFLLLAGLAIKHQSQGIYLLFFIPAMIVTCLALAPLLPLQTWTYSGPLLLFLGLLPLINAPFNWASLA
jgi:hypothetical protein